MENASDLFNEAASMEINPNTVKERFSIKSGDVVLWGVYDITPLKSEMDDLRQQGVLTGEQDPILLAPWDAGISMTLIGLRLKRGDEVVSLFEIDPVTNAVTFPKGHQSVRLYTRVTKNDVAGKYLSIVNDEGRVLKVSYPPEWPTLTSKQKFAYWLYWIGAKFGIPRGSLNRGATFYSYVNKRRGKAGTKYADQWFTDLVRSFKDENEQWLQAPATVGTVPMQTLLRVAAAIDLEWEKEKKLNEQSNIVTGGSEDGAFAPNSDIPF